MMGLDWARQVGVVSWGPPQKRVPTHTVARGSDCWGATAQRQQKAVLTWEVTGRGRDREGR